MIASLRAKTAGRTRSGDGRECGLLKQKSVSREVSSNRGVRPGHGAQAAAWNASLSFVKSHSPKATTINSSSSSTSPETEPGESAVFRFFDAEGERDEDSSTSEEAEQDHITRSGCDPELAARKRKDSYHNPMFHLATANAEKAVASLFPGEDESTLAAMNDSNPLFNRTVSESAGAIARSSRPKQRKEKSKRSGTIARSSGSSSTEGGGCKCTVVGVDCCGHRQRSSKDREESSTTELKRFHSEGWKTGFKVHPAEGTKREKAMYEHVGRMDFRPHCDYEQENKYGKGSIGFRMDTFARNEGESGGKAHFKFVFTVNGYETSNEEGKKRPVLDAIHDRDTGKIRVRVNDGREINAANSIVEIALANVGMVLFNPKIMAKGHHLYTLSLPGRTLFSVLA